MRMCNQAVCGLYLWFFASKGFRSTAHSVPQCLPRPGHMNHGRLRLLHLCKVVDPGRQQRVIILLELVILEKLNSSRHNTAPWWSVENADKQIYVSSICSHDDWQDCGSSTVNFVPNPKAAKAEKTSPASVSAQALANFSYKDSEVIIIEKSCKNVNVEPWAVSPQQCSFA